jgi:hypothetical protein
MTFLWLPSPASGATDITPGSLDDALDEDATWIAKDPHIDVEEARRRLDLQTLAGDLEAHLAQEYPASFAGLWIENDPRFRVVVASTAALDIDLQAHIRGTDLEGVVDQVVAEYSLENSTPRRQPS